ncbi:hypothetical protein Ae201684P_004989 [Aphanomyces euteiches]|nr:hypothetical protein Ae201684P_004989 [Aphanomyces euteiches]KAH9144872.1 hypothetical protein AeRB84_011193 [Aphanomyces euteiches]
MMAALAGHVDIVKKLLEKQAEIDIQDLKKKTCLDLLSEFDHQGLTAEKQSRANTVEFRDKLVQSLVGMTRDEALLKGGFRKAINCSPELARTFLDDCVVINRHDIKFSALEQIYGQIVETSVLHSIIELKTDDPDFIMEARKKCLEHVVMRRVMQIKWEIFGQRKYIEQLMMNMLLFVTSTVSSITFDGDELKVSSGAVILGISAVVFTVLSFIFVQFLRPQSLWRIARYLHDGSFTLDPHLEIPDLAVKKGRAKVLLVQIVLFLTAALVVPLLYLMDGLNLVKYFPKFNNGVLWLTVSFFLVTEINEARAGVLKYFKSDINKAQMTIYLVIFFVFVPLKLNLVTLGQSHDTLLAIEIGIGSFISIMLWVLTVQFLEVVPSASYLLPMMSNLLNDVWNFFILFGVFQMGLTITFYQLFKKTGDDSFSTITQSFITTYFVTFGELPLDSLNSFKGKDGNANKNEFLSACAVVLMMFLAAVVVILLLNVLLAMMNKTVDSGFDKAKTEALASYAKCILRLEESMNNKEHENIAMINFKDANGKPVLNPIFDENVPKSSIEIPDEQEAGIDAYQKKKKVWLDLMTKLQTIVGEEFTTFDN